MKLVQVISLLFAAAVAIAAQSTVVKSPDKRVALTFSLTSDGEPRYSLAVDGKPALLNSKLGIVREDADFTRELELVSVSKPENVRDRYETLASKRRLNDYRANRVTATLARKDGKIIEIVFQVSNDGLAFRYNFPGRDSAVYRITDEATTFNFGDSAKAWLQPKAPAQTGWERSQPSYEEYYEKEISAGTPSKLGAGWVFPALFRNGDVWVAVSESGFFANYSGTSLAHSSDDGEYKIAMPNEKEKRDGEPYLPESTLPWSTPWRVVAAGTLKTIVESNLGIDVAEPAKTPLIADAPGKSSWSWVLLGDSKTTFDVQKQFIDYAADMGWKYCLIDSHWDSQIGYEKIAELATYAKSKNVRIILWYNSAGAWNTTPLTPRNMMLTQESRMKEFEKIAKIGIAGLKVDFFGGDGQSFMKYYRDILVDAAKFGLVMNFHGATLPRGLTREFPNLMTMEAIRGMEFATFEQKNADQAPSHGAMMPFTRNLFDPMDFTPVAMGRLNSRVTRRTTSAFELATSVVYFSGVQHYAETPEGMAKAPAFVKEFMKSVPSVWDEIRFLDGYPGKYAVIARRSGKQWFVGAVNGENADRAVSLDLRGLGGAKSFNLISDGDGGDYSFVTKTVDASKPFTFSIRPHGGFVMR